MEKLEGLSLTELMDTLTEKQAKFVIHASVIAGHLPRWWLEDAIRTSRGVKND